MKNIVLSMVTMAALATTAFVASSSVSCDPANCTIEQCKDMTLCPPGCCDLSKASAVAVQTAATETVAEAKCCSKAKNLK